MLKVDLNRISQSYAKVRKASNEALARTHYINFLREESKFFDSSDKLANRIEDLSLKAIPQFFKSVKHFGKMTAEKLKSAYYFNK